MTRIALIHALAHSMAPIQQSFQRLWPQAQLMNLLDDSLSADLARGEGQLDAAMHARFHALADYAVGQGAQALLFTCSAFGPCIEAVAQRRATVPVLKPNEAMIADAVAANQQTPDAIGLLATFAPTLVSMPDEFPAAFRPRLALAQGALDALNRGDVHAHDAAAVAAAEWLKQQGCTTICLAQFSLARAASAVAQATGLPVLTTPDSAVRELQRRLGLG